MEKALVTLAIGLPEEECRTHAIFEAYARRHGLELVILDTPRFRIRPNLLIKRRVQFHVEKFQLREILERFDRVLFLDSDIILHPGCPDLLGLVPSGRLGCVYDDLGGEAWKRREELERMAARLGPLPEGNRRYFNTGVMVLDASHRGLFRMDRKAFVRGRWPEQTLLNYRSLQAGLPLEVLDPTYNFMPDGGNGWNLEARRREAMVVHYAGQASKAVMLRDLDKRLQDWGLA